jgi:hypothetical protein
MSNVCVNKIGYQYHINKNSLRLFLIGAYKLSCLVQTIEVLKTAGL